MGTTSRSPAPGRFLYDGTRPLLPGDAMRTHTKIDSPIGTLTLVATDGVLSGLYMEDQLHLPDPSSFGPRDGTGFEEAAEQLEEYFAGERTAFTLRTRLHGSAFQRRVWQALTTIPYGQTWSYAQLADAVGRPDRVRAVGATNGRNPLAVVVPCHRVIGSDGSLTGYGGGLARKRFLLDLERPSGPAAGRLF
jgi:methylated-DNA-[protein]-cysteine S-methyltransferase